MAKVIDISERIFLTLLAISFWVNIYSFFYLKPYLIGLAISETIGVIFILLRRHGQIATSPYPLFIALMGTSLPLFARAGGQQIAPVSLIEILLFGGLIITIWAKIALNRSFGIVAANRGVKVSGPYRFVRHPMYLGYIVTQLGFLLSEFSLTLMVIYLFSWLFQILRIVEEEKVLMQDPDYQAYAHTVPRRLMFGF